jgi:catechol 2,3-dioxygenase-like lactoylglutathione lyase family enzyme
VPNNTFFHYGVVVDDVTETSRFLEQYLGFKLVQERVIEHPYISKLIGKDGVSADVALLQIDENSFIELLKWHLPETDKISKARFTLDLFEFGAQHLCVFTNEIEILYRKIVPHKLVRQISNGIVTVEAGPNVGARVFFVKLFDCLFLEVFQKVK